MVHNILTPEQKESQINICTNIEKYPKQLERAWWIEAIFTYTQKLSANWALEEPAFTKNEESSTI